MAIRSYGPGKFNTLLDSYVYGLTLDGGADEEVSLGDGNGWYGFVGLGHDEVESVRDSMEKDGEPITTEEDELLESSPAVILFERSDGLVEANWFDDLDEAEKQWAAIEEDFEGDDEDEDEEGDD